MDYVGKTNKKNCYGDKYQALLDAIHEHIKRMNYFIKFSEPFIQTTYAKNVVSVNFENNITRKEKQNFKKSVIKCVGSSLSSKFWTI